MQAKSELPAMTGYNANSGTNTWAAFAGTPTFEIAVLKNPTVFQYQPRLDGRLQAAIEDSRSILSLEDNWDHEGSPGGYSKSTWDRVTGFLNSLWADYSRRTDRLMPVPEILPDSKGR